MLKGKTMKTLKEIESEFMSTPAEDYDGLFESYQDDPRAGVVKLLARFRKKAENLAAEKQRIESLKQFEYKYRSLGLVAGIDEVGRGPLAGPVVACAVILPENEDILYLNDSKKLTAARREELCCEIMEKAVGVGLGVVSHERIDEINILQATYEAMRQAIAALPVKPQVLLNDAVRIPDVDIQQVPIIHGDASSVSIAAASIVAKVHRDAMMDQLASRYPEYDFSSNKGYGTAAHVAALRKYGPCPIHRKTFIKNFV